MNFAATHLVIGGHLFWLFEHHKDISSKATLSNHTRLRRLFQQALPDISLHTALSSELVLHQVGVVGGGDEVMAQRLAHVLEDAPPLWVKDGALN